MRSTKQFFVLVLTSLLMLSLAIPAFSAVLDTGFSDVAPDAWYAEAVMYCKEHGLMAVFPILRLPLNTVLPVPCW